MIPAFFTDHHAVAVAVEIAGPDFGKGYWKFNNDVLEEYAFREGFAEIWWEDIKKKIKKFTVDYCTARSKARKKEFVTIQKEIAKIYALRNIGGVIDEEGYLENLKKRQEELLEEKARAVTYKLKKEEYLDHEKCSSYFFSKMKTRDKRGVIMELEREGKMMRGRDDLIRTVEEYYGNLFTKEKMDEGKGERFIRSLRRRLPEEKKWRSGGGNDIRRIV